MKPTNTHRHPWRTFSVLGAAALLILTSAGCLPRPTPAPLPTLRPTSTPVPSVTQAPTNTPAPRLPTPTPTPAYLITTVDLGETIELGDLVLTLAPIPPISEAFTPAEGRRFVLLDLTIQNVGERVAGINAGRDLVLKDDTQQIYRINPAAVAATGGATPDVDLAPGEIIRAQIGFDVPLSARNLVLSFAADRFDAGRIFIRLP